MTSVVRNQICCTNMKHRGALHNVDRVAAVQPVTLSTWSRYTDTSLYGRSPRAAAAATEWAFLASLFWNDFVLHILQYFCSHLSLHRACSSPSRHAKESNSRAPRMLKRIATCLPVQHNRIASITRWLQRIWHLEKIGGIVCIFVDNNCDSLIKCNALYRGWRGWIFLGGLQREEMII